MYVGPLHVYCALLKVCIPVCACVLDHFVHIVRCLKCVFMCVGPLHAHCALLKVCIPVCACVLDHFMYIVHCLMCAGPLHVCTLCIA